MKKNRILIIVFKGIGDVVLTTPLLKALKKHRPESELFFLTRKFASKVLENNPDVSGVIIREERPLTRILGLRPDTVIDFMLSSSSGAYSLFSGAKTRIAFYRPWGKIFHNKQVKSDFSGYTVRRRLELLRPLGINPDGITDLKPEVGFTGKNSARVDAWFEKNGLSPADKPATFDITSPRNYRMLSAEKFIAVADRLAGEKGIRPVFLAGPGEAEYVNASLKKYSLSDHLACFDFDLLDLACLFGRVKLHVGTSSSPMHIAVSQDTPTFTVYSPYTDPANWSPPSERHAWFQGDLEKTSAREIYSRLETFSETVVP